MPFTLVNQIWIKSHSNNYNMGHQQDLWSVMISTCNICNWMFLAAYPQEIRYKEICDRVFIATPSCSTHEVRINDESCLVHV